MKEPTIAELVETIRLNRQNVRESGLRAFDPRPTGHDLVQASGVRCVIGPRNRFYWWDRTIMLTRDVATGRDAESLMIARHEIAHSQQPRWLFWFLFVPPVRWWLEMNAWERVFGSV